MKRFPVKSSKTGSAFYNGRWINLISSKQVVTPDNKKDDHYWAKRSKNNFAAKRSREARRLKENQIALRASYLEKENIQLKLNLKVCWKGDF